MANEKAESIDRLESEENKKKRSSVTSFGKRVSSSGVGGSTMRCCQAEKCTADLKDAKQYHKRHKVCENHAKAQVVNVGGIRQRFCQQCSRFHELCEFDEAKMSCRRRLAGHNERRRKNNSAAESHARDATDQIKDGVCGQISVQETATYKHFDIS